MKNKRLYIFSSLALIVINLVALYLLWRNYSLRKELAASQIEESRLAYGSKVGLFSVKDLNGKTIDLSDHGYAYKLLVFFNPLQAENSRLKYYDVLSRRYSSRGLLVIGISGGTEEQTREFLNSSRIKFPVLVDSDLSIHRNLRVGPDHEHGATIMIDRDGIVRFSDLRILREDHIRQIVERHLLGFVDYSLFKPSTDIFRINDRLPDLRVLDVETGQQVKLNHSMAKDTALIIFTAQCSSCELDQYINRLNKIGEDYMGKKAVGIFGSNFSLRELQYYLKSKGIRPKVYMLLEKVSGLEDDYATRYDLSAFPVVVLTNESGEVISVKLNPMEGS